MELFHRYHEEPNLDTRPARLPSTVPPELRLFAELTSMPRRKSTVPKSTTKADEWRNSGGKNACVCFEVQPELIFDGEGDGLFLARRTGKLKRDGEVDLTYHQFNIDRTARPGSRGGQVTIYHILPLQVNRKQGLGLHLRGATSNGRSRRGAKQEADGAAAGQSDATSKPQQRLGMTAPGLKAEQAEGAGRAAAAASTGRRKDDPKAQVARRPQHRKTAAARPAVHPADEGDQMNPVLAALPPLQQRQRQRQRQPQQPQQPPPPPLQQQPGRHDSDFLLGHERGTAEGDPTAAATAGTMSRRPQQQQSRPKSKSRPRPKPKPEPRATGMMTLEPQEDQAIQFLDSGQPVLDFTTLSNGSERPGSSSSSDAARMFMNVDVDGEPCVEGDAAVPAKRRRTLNPVTRGLVSAAAGFCLIGCAALVLLSFGRPAGSPAPGSKTSDNDDAHPRKPDGCNGFLVRNAKRWPARCSSSSTDEGEVEFCPSDSAGGLPPRVGCRLWCEAGFEPRGNLCCGPDGRSGEAQCTQCPAGTWSDGARPCQACTVCERDILVRSTAKSELRSLIARNCTRTEDTVCHTYWKEMLNTHPKPSTRAHEESSTWHLPRDFMTWSNGRSLYAFGGVESSLPADTNTSDTCVSLSAQGLYNRQHYPAGTSEGEPYQITDELWQLELPQQQDANDEMEGLVRVELESQSIDPAGPVGLSFEPICRSDAAHAATTPDSCEAAGKGCAWKMGVDRTGTCSNGLARDFAVVKTIAANAGYPPHPRTDTIAAVQPSQEQGQSERVSQGWVLRAVNDVWTGNKTYEEQMDLVTKAAMNADAGAKFTLSFTNSP